MSAILRPITTTLHEFGHAIPALLFTKDRVKIFIGSYKNLDKSIQYKIGRLIIYFRYSPFNWSYGICEFYDNNLSKIKQILILLSGSLFAFIVSFGLTLLSIEFEWHDTIKIIVMVLLLSSTFDLFRDLVPKKLPVMNFDGNNVFNDGQSILNVLRKPETRFKFIDSKEIENYNLEKHPKNKAYKYFLSAQEKLKKGDFEGVVQDYSKAIENDIENSVYYNNRGYYLTHLEKYNDSISDFTKAIELNKDFAFAYNNRGFAYLMLNDLERGFDDILKSLSFDKFNSYSIRNLGIYYYKTNNFIQAKKHFEKAFKLDNATPLIDDYLEKIKSI